MLQHELFHSSKRFERGNRGLAVNRTSGVLGYSPRRGPGRVCRGARDPRAYSMDRSYSVGGAQRLGRTLRVGNSPYWTGMADALEKANEPSAKGTATLTGIRGPVGVETGISH